MSLERVIVKVLSTPGRFVLTKVQPQLSPLKHLLKPAS